jgi:hypothetical protein
VNARQEWRNAVRDSTLDGVAKLVAYTLDTYMDGDGETWPSTATVAAGAQCGRSTVKRAVHRLEDAQLVLVIRSKGRRPNRYRATMPPPNGSTSEPVNRSTGEPVKASNGFRDDSNGFTSGPRTRSTELERPSRTRERQEPRPLAGAYQPFADKPPDITVDQAALKLARSWLQVQHQ